MERRFQFSEGEYYHVYNRGVEKRTVFQNENDMQRFLELLYLANGSKSIVYRKIKGLPFEWDRGEAQTGVIAYSLMRNHFHIIAREDKNGGISKFMGKLATSYSMYFNTKYDRTGALMSHPFRARHIDDDDYFRWVVSYVHANPISHELRQDPSAASKFLHAYKFSSYQDYFFGHRDVSVILDSAALPISIQDLESVDVMLKELKKRDSDGPL